MPVKYDVSNIPPFYQSLMNTWSLFSHQKATPPSPVDGIPLEPLWYNSYVTHNSNIITDTVIQQLISLGITQVYICLLQTLGPYKSMNEHNIKIKDGNKISELKQVLHTHSKD